jgi:hypothetical protein
MNIGMLWYDNDLKDKFDAKVERAATYYREKYGKSPSLCFVHPSMISNKDNSQTSEKSACKNGSAEKRFKAAGVEIRTHSSILPHHFWIGVNGKRSGQTSSA